MMKHRELKWIITDLAAALFYALLGLLLIRFILNSGKWPAGDDVMYHIYRGEKVYEALKQGHLWVSLDPQWYNGVELLRYWSPLPAYVMALCIFLAGGAPFAGYLIYTWLLFFLSACIWYAIGIRKDRRLFGFCLGLLWFLLPQNISYYFASGNLAGMLGNACVLPLFVYAVRCYLDEADPKNLWRLALTTALLALCHSGFALLAILTSAIWILLRKIMVHEARHGMDALFIMLAGFLLTGVWFLASRKGVPSIDYSEQLKASFQPLFMTLDPFDRMHSQFAHTYFGLSVFLTALIGSFFAGKKGRSACLSAVAVCLLTSTTAYELIRLLPGGSYLWTARMIPSVSAVFFCGLLEWTHLRKIWQILVICLMAVDFLPAVQSIGGPMNGTSVTDRFDSEDEVTLLAKAKEVTKQRIALIDASSLGSTGAYLSTSWNGKYDAAFGAGYEAAVTRPNIIMLNRAAVDGSYLYLFDRAKELGCDTVDVQIRQLKNGRADLISLDEAALKNGYTMVDQNEGYVLYHLDEVTGTFGLVNTYHGIAIGKHASDIAEYYPMLKEADETDLSAFTYEDLKQYDVIVLDGFTMEDRVSSEEMMEKLSENGTRIVVMADGVPIDKGSRLQEFLGVTCQPVTFENGYPEMDTMLGKMDLPPFPSGYERWNTVYMNGLDQVEGSVRDTGMDLAFLGTVKNDNIIFVGLNLSYYYSLSASRKCEALLSAALDTETDALPERKITDLKIEETAEGMNLTCEEDHVDTTLSYHDIFTSEQPFYEEQNLLHVDHGTTVIRYAVPALWQGSLLSLAALVSLAALSKHASKEKHDASQK